MKFKAPFKFIQPVLHDYERLRVRRSVAIVEGGRDVRHSLWERYAKDAFNAGSLATNKWQSVSDGFLRQIGQIGNMQVWMEMWWDVINGQLVTFWELTSVVKDYRMGDQVLDEILKDVFPTPLRTDAMNFHNVLYEIERANALGALNHSDLDLQLR